MRRNKAHSSNAVGNIKIITDYQIITDCTDNAMFIQDLISEIHYNPEIRAKKKATLNNVAS